MSSILITGMSGLIGTATAAAIRGEHQISALNRRAVDGVTTTRASLEDYNAIVPAFTDQDIVVHLAAEISDSAGWPALLATNVVGTRNVFAAAIACGVRRVVFASSGATVSGWEQVEPYRSLVSGQDMVSSAIPLIDESMSTRPGNLYASTKVWGESIARHYSINDNLEVVCLRIGFANAEDRPLNDRQFSVWNSQRDVVQAIELALTVKLPDNFDTFFILSDNARGYRDISRAKSALGFVPQDSADDYS